MDWARRAWNGFLLVAAVLAGIYVSGVAAVVLAIIGLTGLYRSLSGLKSAMPWFTEVRLMRFQNLAVVLAVAWLLGSYWLPLGPGSSQFVNFLFVLLLLGAVLGLFRVFIYLYPRMLGWCLRHKAAFFVDTGTPPPVRCLVLAGL